VPLDSADSAGATATVEVVRPAGRLRAPGTGTVCMEAATRAALRRGARQLRAREAVATRDSPDTYLLTCGWSADVKPWLRHAAAALSAMVRTKVLQRRPGPRLGPAHIVVSLSRKSLVV